MDNIRKSYDDNFRRYIVSEIENGVLSRADARKEYGVTQCLIKDWLEEYGRFRPKRDILEIVMKSEKDKISELEKALAAAHLKIRVYDEILNMASKKYKVDLKKTFGMEQSEGSSEQDLKLNPSAKRSK